MDTLKVTGWVEVRKNGKVVYKGENLVVNLGLALIASRLVGTSSAVPAYMAVGNSATDPAAGQTALVGTEWSRVVASHNAVDNTVTYIADFTGTNASQKSVREFGIFNATPAGVMLCRFICEAIAWDVGDTLQVTWSINIGVLG